jgi:hypothetical protein
MFCDESNGNIANNNDENYANFGVNPYNDRFYWVYD